MYTMPPPQQIQVDENDDSASDADFNPDAQAVDEDSSSDEDEAAPVTAGQKRRGAKRSRKEDRLDAELDSGDEAPIQERRKRKKHKARGSGVDEEGDEDTADFLSDDDGGEGGFIKTRAQRRIEKVERRALASTHGATVDVDAVWRRLSAMPIGRPAELDMKLTEGEDNYITIKRTTKFAGQITTEEKRVLKWSKEAKIWLQEQEAAKRKRDKDKENEVPQPQGTEKQQQDDALGD
jgi:hypothetical protein